MGKETLFSGCSFGGKNIWLKLKYSSSIESSWKKKSQSLVFFSRIYFERSNPTGKIYKNSTNFVLIEQ